MTKVPVVDLIGLNTLLLSAPVTKMSMIILLKALKAENSQGFVRKPKERDMGINTSPINTMRAILYCLPHSHHSY